MTAVRRVAQDGEVTVSAVSAAAGVTRATFYNHFRSLEEAAWLAVSDSFDQLLGEDVTARRAGNEPGVVGVGSLRRIVELLREHRELVRLADSFRSEEVLLGVADVVLIQVRRFRVEFGAGAGLDTGAEDLYIAAGLYAVLATGARGTGDAARIASTGYDQLPGWMRHPGT